MDYIKNTLTIVIFGATGDLNRRKLIPALFSLYKAKKLPSVFRVVGFSRGEMSNEAYRKFIFDVLKEHDAAEDPSLVEFCEHLYFVQGVFDEPKAYQRLQEELYTLDLNEGGQCSNKLFYLAVPPVFYDSIFENLANSGLSIACTDHQGWTRVLVEKPFGRDLETAEMLDKKLALLFKENQIFRIDHYLAKETLENVLAFRFSNLIFDPVWNKEYIESVHIKLFETIGVESRGAFYEGVGALRDVAENHALQMLTLVAMENPSSREADIIREKRVEILSTLNPITGDAVNAQTIKGQYEGYKKEPEVNSESKIATYFKITAYINTDRWDGVPFILEGGKKLSEQKTEVIVHFKETPTCICDDSGAHTPHPNTITFTVAPRAGIRVRFWTKKPGFEMVVEPHEFVFEYENPKDVPGAYQKLLLSALIGDQTQFTNSQEVEAAWRFITPILEVWKEQKPEIYKPGSDGLENKKIGDKNKSK